MSPVASLLADPKWNPDTLLAWVKDLLHDQLGVDQSAILPNATLWHDLGCDSLDFVELQLTTEEAFGIEIEDTAVEQLFNVTEQTVLVSHLSGYLWHRCKQLRVARVPSQVAGKQRTAEAMKAQKDDPTK